MGRKERKENLKYDINSHGLIVENQLGTLQINRILMYYIKL